MMNIPSAGLFGDWPPLPSSVETPVVLAEDAPDLAEIAGQQHARRALEVAAAGGHSLVLTGVPGSGKSLLARALVGLLPPLTSDEAQDIQKRYTHRGLALPAWLAARQRPAVFPTPAIAPRQLIGSARQPGMLFFARHGVLGLDRLDQGMPELAAALGTLLDQPAGQQIQLVVTLEPCPCGYYGDPVRECVCPASQLMRAVQRTRRVVERLPLSVQLARLDYDRIASSRPGESSAQVRARVLAARQVASTRQQEPNATLPFQQLGQYCPLDASAQKLLKAATQQLHLDTRSYHQVLRVARTIADLAGSQGLQANHLAEAIQYLPHS